MWVSSEFRVLQGWLEGDLDLCQAALASFLKTGSVAAPLTMDRRIRCLPPGGLLEWYQGRLEEKRWFTPGWPGEEAWIQDRDAQRERVREVVLKSVQAHLVADVPVGVFLSGGLDSTLMAAAMRELGQDRIQAFSIGFEDGSGVPDESAAARRTAEYLGCEFRSRSLTASSLFSELDGYFDRLDQPTGDALNTYLVSQLAAQEVKVTLSGLGADEWFGGYNYHRLAAVAAASPFTGIGFRSGLGAAIGSLLKRVPSSVHGHPAAKALLYGVGAMGTTAEQWQLRARTIFEADEVESLAGATVAGALGSEAPEPSAGSWLDRLLLRETKTYLADTLLRDNDVTSMAHSLELRVPLVDPEVFDLAGMLPPEAKLGRGVGKRILRDAFHDLLPPWIADDRRKKTFTLPLMRWMRSPQWRDRVRDTLASDAFRSRGWIDPDQASRVVDDYFRHSDGSKRSWRLSQSVWMLFVLESWAQRNVKSFKPTGLA